MNYYELANQFRFKIVDETKIIIDDEIKRDKSVYNNNLI